MELGFKMIIMYSFGLDVFVFRITETTLIPALKIN